MNPEDFEGIRFYMANYDPNDPAIKEIRQALKNEILREEHEERQDIGSPILKDDLLNLNIMIGQGMDLVEIVNA